MLNINVRVPYMISVNYHLCIRNNDYNSDARLRYRADLEDEHEGFKGEIRKEMIPTVLYSL